MPGGGAGVAKIRRNSKKGSHGFLGKGEAAVGVTTGSVQAVFSAASSLGPCEVLLDGTSMLPTWQGPGGGGGGLPSLVFARRLPVTAHQPGPCPSWLESLLRVVAEDSRGWHVCSYPREEG